MLRAALRDLQWRWKRFVIAMVGVALVFAMGLIMTGLSESFSLEVDRTLQAIDAERVGRLRGRVRSRSRRSSRCRPALAGPDASPVMVLRQTIADAGTLADIIVVGVEPGRLGSPRAADGVDLDGPGEAVSTTRWTLPASGTRSRWAAPRSGWSARCRVSASTPACRWCTSPWPTPRRWPSGASRWRQRSCSPPRRRACPPV